MSAIEHYFVPQPSRWPIVGACGALLLAVGAATWVNDGAKAPYVLLLGAVWLGYVLVGWFGDIISEGRAGVYNGQVERSFRVGMAWFIFSEIVVFAILFWALLYMRFFVEHDLAAGETKALIWPSFSGGWPASGPGISGTFTAMSGKGIPLLNTLMLLASGGTVTLAMAALERNRRGLLILCLLVTVCLGILFLRNQASEYHHAYTAMHLTLATGAYGATFFMLTGLHGLHVAIGSMFLLVMLGRVLAGDFTAKDHLAFQAATWYWHFVGVVWLILFVIVYWL